MAGESDDRFARGIAMALELFTPRSGTPRPPVLRIPKEVADDWNRFSISTVMGDVWGRPGLEPRDRARITIGVLTALDKPAQLRSYVTAGINLGLSREEICEIILHVAAYAGFPAAIQGLAVASEVFDGLEGD